MLEAIRKRSTGIVTKILLALLVLSFAVWGIGDMVSLGSGSNNVAEVGDIEITVSQLDYEARREVEKYKRMFGPDFDLAQARDMGIVSQVLNRMVQRALYDQGANELGLLISDEQIASEIRNNPLFFNQLGQFDRAVFENWLRNSGYSEGLFTSMLREDLKRGQYIGITTTVSAPLVLAETAYLYANERRVVDYVTLSPMDQAAPAAPSESDLIAYHSENSARFMAPETRRLTALALNGSDLAGDVDVTEEEIQTAYDERSAEFIIPERRTIEQVLFADEASAKAAAGVEFTAMGDVISLGEFTRDTILPELADAAFGNAEGIPSAPVETPLGWHIVRASAVVPGTTKGLEQVRAQVKADVQLYKAVDHLYDLTARVEDALGGGSTLEEAASTFNIPLITLDAIDALGNGLNGEKITTPEGLLKAAFAADEGMDSGLIEISTEAYVIVRVDGVTLSAVRPLNTVRDSVTAAWTADARQAEARAQADTQMASLNSGGALSGSKTSTAFLRDGTDAGELDSGLISATFSAKVGEAVRSEGPAGVIVAVVKEIISADAKTDKAGVEALTTELNGAISNDLLSQLGELMRLRHGASVNPSAVDKLF